MDQMILGNYMPKAQPNHVFGTRIKTTLENDEDYYDK